LAEKTNLLKLLAGKLLAKYMPTLVNRNKPDNMRLQGLWEAGKVRQKLPRWSVGGGRKV